MPSTSVGGQSRAARSSEPGAEAVVYGWKATVGEAEAAIRRRRTIRGRQAQGRAIVGVENRGGREGAPISERRRLA